MGTKWGPSGEFVDGERTKTLVWFRAGRCILNGTLVKPDPQKGVLRVFTSNGGPPQAQFVKRPSGASVETIRLFRAARLAAIPNCPARVVVLKFAPSEPQRVRLFWFQEPDASRDNFLISAFNAAIEAPGADVIPPPGPPLAEPPNPQQQQQDELREMLAAAAGQRGAQVFPFNKQVSLSKVLDSEAISILSQDAEAMQQLAELMPDGLKNSSEVLAALRCPQISWSLSSLTQAIYTDPLPILSSMGVTPTTSPIFNAMERFATSLEAAFAAPGAAAAAPPPPPPPEAAAAAAAPEAAAAAPEAAAAAAPEAAEEPQKMEEDGESPKEK